jgi:hypothetical protein
MTRVCLKSRPPGTIESLDSGINPAEVLLETGTGVGAAKPVASPSSGKCSATSFHCKGDAEASNGAAGNYLSGDRAFAYEGGWILCRRPGAKEIQWYPRRTGTGCRARLRQARRGKCGLHRRKTLASPKFPISWKRTSGRGGSTPNGKLVRSIDPGNAGWNVASWVRAVWKRFVPPRCSEVNQLQLKQRHWTRATCLTTVVADGLRLMLMAPPPPILRTPAIISPVIFVALPEFPDKFTC